MLFFVNLFYFLYIIIDDRLSSVLSPPLQNVLQVDTVSSLEESFDGTSIFFVPIPIHFLYFVFKMIGYLLMSLLIMNL
jgi:hypothetical protein